MFYYLQMFTNRNEQSSYDRRDYKEHRASRTSNQRFLNYDIVFKSYELIECVFLFNNL